MGRAATIAAVNDDQPSDARHASASHHAQPVPRGALAHLREAFTARFDDAVLRAPAWDTALPDVPAGVVDTLRAWCFHGTGSGAWPLWAPSAAPDLPLPFAVAALQAAGADEAVLLLGLQLDGSVQLQQQPGRAAGIALRLAVKLHDAMWWRRRQPSDPWDFGVLREDADAALVHFTPRRATLIVANGTDPARALHQCALLRSHAPAFQRPVRLLLTGCAPEGVARIATD